MVGKYKSKSKKKRRYNPFHEWKGVKSASSLFRRKKNYWGCETQESLKKRSNK